MCPHDTKYEDDTLNTWTLKQQKQRTLTQIIITIMRLVIVNNDHE